MCVGRIFRGMVRFEFLDDVRLKKVNFDLLKGLLCVGCKPLVALAHTSISVLGEFLHCCSNGTQAANMPDGWSKGTGDYEGYGGGDLLGYM